MAGAFAALAVLALAVSCTGFFPNPTLTSIQVGPTSVNIPVGQTQAMTATGTYDDGSTKTVTSTSGIVWQSSDDTTATVSGTGVVTGVAVGSPSITAQLGTVSGQATVNITLTNVTSIVITPKSQNIPANGGSQTFQAFANVSGSSTQVDVSAQAVWSIVNSANSANYTLSQGVTPETVTTTSTATIGEIDQLMATYTSGTTQFTATATITVTSQ